MQPKGFASMVVHHHLIRKHPGFCSCGSVPGGDFGEGLRYDAEVFGLEGLAAGEGDRVDGGCGQYLGAFGMLLVNELPGFIVIRGVKGHSLGQKDP